MDAEKQRTASEKEHLARSAAFTAAEARCKALERKLSRYKKCNKHKLEFTEQSILNNLNYIPTILILT